MVLFLVKIHSLFHMYNYDLLVNEASLNLLFNVFSYILGEYGFPV